MLVGQRIQFLFVTFYNLERFINHLIPYCKNVRSKVFPHSFPTIHQIERMHILNNLKAQLPEINFAPFLVMWLCWYIFRMLNADSLCTVVVSIVIYQLPSDYSSERD